MEQSVDPLPTESSLLKTEVSALAFGLTAGLIAAAAWLAFGREVVEDIAIIVGLLFLPALLGGLLVWSLHRWIERITGSFPSTRPFQRLLANSERGFDRLHHCHAGVHATTVLHLPWPGCR